MRQVMVFSLGLFVPFLSAEGQNRQKLVEQFNQVEEERARSLSPSMSLDPKEKEEREPAMGVPNYTFRERLLNLKDPTQLPEPLSEETKKEFSSAQTMSDRDHFHYFLALKKAYPCFRDFLSAVLQARADRDQRYISCEVNGAKDCAPGQILQQAEKKHLTLSDKFYACLQEDA